MIDKTQPTPREKDIRSALQVFALYQESILRKHDDKLHWSRVSNKYLLKRLKDEVQELASSLWNKGQLISRDDVQCECADVANFAMMIFDNIEKGKG
jgi:hypothetical protein